MSDKVYDLTQLEELAGGSQEFVMSMVETFLEHTPSQLADMVDSYKEGDLKAMGGNAHKIKPNIDLFGITGISAEIRQIEALGKAENDDGSLSGLIGKVSDTLRIAFAQLKLL